MANFLFNETKLLMLNGGAFDWMADQIVGVLYDNRITVTEATTWATLQSYVVSTSANMGGRQILADGRVTGEPLAFTGVTTEPGVRIRGLVLKFVTSHQLIKHYSEGLDGFSGNTDISIEANNISMVARPPANNQGAWFKL